MITAKDVASIYEVPLVFAHEKVDRLALRYLHLEASEPDLSRWEELVHRVYNPKDEVTIGIVGKYVEYEDSYKSLKEALVHGALAYNLKLNVNWIEAEGLEQKDQSVQAQLEHVDGILVPGGFGKRGIEGMLKGIQYARENKVPYLRHLPGHADRVHRVRAQRLRPGAGELQRVRSGHAASRHLQAARAARRGRTGRHHAPGRLDLQAGAGHRWRTRPTARTEISERHRHRYEFNREYESTLTAGGLRISGATPDGTYVEIVEIPDHPFFLGCQFHPEFKSKPLEPHPLFTAFMKASYENRLRRQQQRE